MLSKLVVSLHKLNDIMKYNIKKIDKDRQRIKDMWMRGELEPNFITQVAAMEQITTQTVRNCINGQNKQPLALQREIIYELLKLVRNERG